MTRFRKARNKMGAKGSRCSRGHYHPSQGEARRCEVLHIAQDAGLISDLKVHASYTIVPGFKYKADFAYIENGVQYAEDFKGPMTQRFRDVMRLWKEYGKHPLKVTKMAGARFYVDKEIKPNLPA